METDITTRHRTPEEIEALGYNPDESSDCTFPPELDLRDKLKLLRWRYLEGGHRIPIEIPKVPHVDETEIYSSVVQDEAGFLELAKRLSGDAKQTMMEYIYAKQRFDMLQQEKELLKWHVASDSKVIQLKESQVLGSESRVKALQEKLDETIIEYQRLDKERASLSHGYKHDAKTLEETTSKFSAIHSNMEEWLGRRGDYIAETTIERRQASHERRLRYRQQKKLARAAAIDKKWHVRIDGLRNLDNMIFDAYETAANTLALEFNKAGEVTAPIRGIVMDEIDKSDPFKSFENIPPLLS